MVTVEDERMRINTQFPVAVHILTVLAFFKEDRVSSEIIALSIGTNPVVVRRIMSQLRKKGLVDTQSGVKGALLRKRPEDISLLEIYDAVRSEGDTIFDIHANTSPECPVGSHFPAAMDKPLMSAQRAMEKELGSFTLADVVKPIRQKNGKGTLP